MKDEIRKILSMQEQGLLSEKQTAELLAALADQACEAREKGFAGEAAKAAGGAAGAGKAEPGRGRGTAAGVVHDFVDAAFDVGTTVGRVATVWGSEVASAVHRDEGGNSVTLSKVDAPAGDGFKFRGNSFNVSKVSEVMLRDAEMCENTVNASKVAELSIRRGRFSQCSVSGSSLNDVRIEGKEGDKESGGQGDKVNGEGWSAIRGLTLNASKFSRVQVLEGSVLDGCAITGSPVREVVVGNGTVLKKAGIRTSTVSRVVLDDSEWTNVLIERSQVQGFGASESTMEEVAFSGVKIWESRVKNGLWKNVQIRRETTGREVRIEDSVFERCDLEGCEFVGCTFKRTTLRGVKAKGVTVRNVDFTGMVIEGEEEFRRACGV